MKTRDLSCLGLAAFLAVSVHAANSPAPAASGATAGLATQVPSGPAPTPLALPPNAAEVVKLSDASVGDEVILAYVKNYQSPFNLSADAILRLKEAGVSSPVIAAMLTHDTSLRNQNPPAPYAYSQKSSAPAEQPPGVPTAAQPAPQPQPVAPACAEDQTPPPAPVEVIPVARAQITIGHRATGVGMAVGFGSAAVGGSGAAMDGVAITVGRYGHGGWGGYHGGGGGGGHGGGGHGR